MLGISIVGAVAILSYSTLAEAAFPVLFYLGMNVFEGLLLTPAILGRSLSLSPVAIFLWLMLWALIWGVPGALLAVPLLTALKIVADHVPALSGFARFVAR
jgi:predicted PurR-regulated permease PerM